MPGRTDYGCQGNGGAAEDSDRRYFTGKWRTPVEWEADRDSGKLQDCSNPGTYYKNHDFPELDYMNNLCICLTEKVPSIWHNKRLQKSIRNEYSPILGSDVFEMPVEELSEKQKYQLVYTRVLLQKPEILFCIQPFCGADLAHRMFIWSMLEKFLDKGISVVILSLNLSDSLAMADRLLILGENGEKREIARENFHKITSPVPWLHMYLSERK